MSLCCCRCFCHRLLIIDNFIPPDDKNKILARAEFDEEEDTWRLKALAKGGSVEFYVVTTRRDMYNIICHIICRIVYFDIFCRV